jgi:hypothetical protein
MAKLTTHQIRDLARKIVGQNAGGIRYSQLVEHIATQHPETPRNTVHGSVWDLASRFSGEISKPSRGLFKPIDQGMDEGIEAATKTKTAEKDFYEPFAEFLKNDLDEASECVPFGGAGLKSKWGTPDVVGVYRPKRFDVVQFPPEIVSAEVKLNNGSTIEAFGQAIAYRLFSTKVYVVMPATITEEDKGRLEALCMLFGLGLVVFQPDPAAPSFSIRTKAQRFTPDSFYVNQFAEALKHHDKAVYEILFG